MFALSNSAVQRLYKTWEVRDVPERNNRIRVVVLWQIKNWTEFIKITFCLSVTENTKQNEKDLLCLWETDGKL